MIAEYKTLHYQAHGNGAFVRSATIISTLVILVWAALPLTCCAEGTGPSDVINTFNAALVETMKKAQELGFSGRYKRLEPVIKESFSLPFMASQAVGRFWKGMKEDERNLLLKTYTEWTISTYAGRFDGYSGERFEPASESGPLKGAITVVSKFIQQNNEVVDFYYLLQKKEGKWRIVDIKISGVSQLALTRAQFTDILKEKGFDALIAVLKEKTRGFSQRGK